MLSWLKRRAKLTINNRYINLFRSNINTSMFVSEPVSLINDHNLKLTVFNTEGHDYHLEISNVTTVERVKLMAVGHFFGHLEAVGGSHGEDRSGIKDSKASGSRTYRLVVLRGARPLLDVNPLHLEKIIDDDVLLLVERRESAAAHKESAPEDASSPTVQQISHATASLSKRNDNRDLDTANTSVDFQIEFRRILVTMIEASVRLISADPDSEDVFNQILDKLERRHRPKIDRVALRQLMEMGFEETKATKALQVKRNFNEAMEWLLDEGTFEDSEIRVSDESISMFPATAVDSKSTLDDEQEDPAKKVLKRFLQYRRKWFQPNQQALQKLSMSFNHDMVIDALRASGNNESVALSLLTGEQEMLADDQGLDRDSPIISAILASPVIQLALPKPKTLLALMMLFESPNNANMWLSDPDTHPVVSQVLRIYHAEKHSLNHSRPVSASSGHTETSLSSNLSSSEYRPFPRSNLASRTNSSSSTLLPVGSNSQHYQQFPMHFQERIASNGSLGGDTSNLPWLPSNSSPISMRGSSPNPPLSTPRVDSLLYSSPALSQQGQINMEEPMSHSGSPERGMLGTRTGNSIANGGPNQYTATIASPITNETTDIEMDETVQGLDMETQ